MQRVWHLSRSLHGGGGQYAYQLNIGLRQLGIKSNLLCTDTGNYSDAFQLQLANSTISIYKTRLSRFFLNRYAKAPFHRFIRDEVWQTEELIKPGDIVHLHSMIGWMGYKGLKKIVPSGAHVYWTVHDMWPITGGCIVYQGCDCYQTGCKTCPLLPFPFNQIFPKQELLLKGKFILEYQVKMIANSNWTKNQLQQSQIDFDKQNIPVVYPIVQDTYFFHRNSQEIRQLYDIDPDRPIISMGSASITDPFKGIIPFLDNCLEKKSKLTDIMFIIFGDGKLPDRFVELNILKLDKISNPETLADIYTMSDIFVSPSSMETFGMIIAEAQACGTTVCAFDTGGVRDAIIETDNLVPSGDFDLLLDKTLTVLQNTKINTSDKRLTQKISQRCNSRVISENQVTIYQKQR